jgi:hypothetical protein
MLGLRCLIYILQHPYNKKIILRKNLVQVNMLIFIFTLLPLKLQSSCIK